MSPNPCRSTICSSVRISAAFALFLGLFIASQSMFGLQIDPSKKVQLTVTGKIPNGVATEAYTASVSASGGTAPYVYKVGGVAKGLRMDHSSGAHTGPSPNTGQFSFNFYVTDAAGDHGQGAFNVTFAQPPVSISLAPGTLTIPSAGTQQFLPTVLNTTNTSVTWTVSQGSM